MKIRVRKETRNGTHQWVVETKQWWEIHWQSWQYEDICRGDDAKERALTVAHQCANPTIIEVRQK